MVDERHGLYLEDLQTGMSDVYAKTITDADVVMFAGVTGDTNPVHLDQSFAEKTRFKQRIAHGMLSASFISTVFGTRLPGPGCIYISQTLQFRAPVKVGDTVQARVTISDIDLEKGRVNFETVCTVDGKPVLDGEAVILVSRRQDAAPKPRAAE